MSGKRKGREAGVKIVPAEAANLIVKACPRLTDNKLIELEQDPDDPAVELVTVKVIENHVNLMTPLLTMWPGRASPESMLIEALRMSMPSWGLQDDPMWAKDEAEKLFKIWSYIWMNWSRTRWSSPSVPFMKLKTCLNNAVTDGRLIGPAPRMHLKRRKLLAETSEDNHGDLKTEMPEYPDDLEAVIEDEIVVSNEDGRS